MHYKVPGIIFGIVLDLSTLESIIAGSTAQQLTTFVDVGHIPSEVKDFYE